MGQAFAGDPGNVETLKYKAIYKKATSGGSAILPGKVVTLTESTGVAAIAATGGVGPFGVVPRLAPVNTDSDDTLQVFTGGVVYVTADGAIKPNSRVAISGATAGEVVAFTASATEEYNDVVGIYLGHEGEGSGLTNEATDAADGQVIKILLNDKGENP